MRPRIWAYQSRILQNLECHSVTVGALDIHVMCNLAKKHAPMKVLEMLKKDSSKFVKILRKDLSAFHWQDGDGLFSVSSSPCEAVRHYILNQEEHHRKETFQEEFVRILRKYGVEYDERYLWH
jgi:REP element-mobilizing transposase RayT